MRSKNAWQSSIGSSMSSCRLRPGRRPAVRRETPEQRLVLEPRAIAGRARRVAAVLRQQHAHVHLVALGLEPLEEPAHAVPDLLLPLALAVDDPAPLLVGELAPRRVERDAALAAVPQQVVLAFAVRLGLPRPDRAAAQRLAGVGDDEPVVDADDAAEAAAGLAGAERRIEREQARRRIAVVDVAVGAVQVGREAPHRRRRRRPPPASRLRAGLRCRDTHVTRPRPTRSAASSASTTRARSTAPSRKRSWTISSRLPSRAWTRV